jgi:hypothetical protein
MSNIQKVQLPPHKPDCCADCPLLGLVPKNAARPRYSKKTHLCIGLAKAISERKTHIRESESNDPKHPLQRPCDEHWDRWMTYQRRIITVNKALYRDSRDPYMSNLYPTIDFED